MFNILFLLAFSVGAAPVSAAPESIREITRAVIELEAKFPAPLHAYMMEYYRDIPTASARETNCEDILSRALDHRFVLVGDLHNKPEPAMLLERMMEHMLRHGQNPTVVIEFIFHTDQAVIDEYLSGGISLEEVRRRVRFDDFHWAWKWDDISRVLAAGKRLKLRVISGELGVRAPSDRDRFTAETIHRDAAGAPNRKYLIFYGTAHLLGENHIGDRLKKLGRADQLAVINFLGRATEPVLDAMSPADANCIRFSKNLSYVSKDAPSVGLREYHEYLRGRRRGLSPVVRFEDMAREAGPN